VHADSHARFVFISPLVFLDALLTRCCVFCTQEHLEFLEKALMPLHRPKNLAAFHQQLAYCVMQYIEKDPTTSVVVVNGLLKSWPWTVSAKQVVFLNELEEVLELMGPELLDTIIEPLFKAIAKCVGSFHFQVCCVAVIVAPPPPLAAFVAFLFDFRRLRSARCSCGTMTTC
jgi:hypothetical protein